MLSGVVRVVSHPRIFRVPTSASDILAALQELRQAAGVAVVPPGSQHWRIVSRLCKTAGVRGNLVPDAYHAALAIEQGATWVSLDRDFARFPGLRRAHP